LEQAFNSLHAQREACEAFIRSQRHEGWSCLPQAYDDGGRSGATMDRPALQLLLTAIREGRVDVVVVYKIDRLTRSLADFVKIVEIFDAKGVSFVSVTQQFNTAISMGRLTLNVLLSFAQFERELTGERIRDKIAASKKKGMWMGGMPPLGYTIRDRKLVVVEPEAETVCWIFGRYAALGSVRLLQQEVAARGVTGKSWTSASGRIWGGKPIGRGALYLILQNRIYRGEAVHKNQTYPGEHEAIIDSALWDRVQIRLGENKVERNSGIRVKNPKLLAGLLFDGAGQRMTPTHAVKRGRRCSYYVSRPLIINTRADAASGLRIAAAEIEQIVVKPDPPVAFGAGEPLRDLWSAGRRASAAEPHRPRGCAGRRLGADAATTAAGHPSRVGATGRGRSRSGADPSSPTPARGISRRSPRRRRSGSA
jgi:site-specific DNA recombinase